MSDEEIIDWVAEQVGYNISDEDALAMYEIYRQYRDEGQSHEVSKQYAGIFSFSFSFSFFQERLIS